MRIGISALVVLGGAAAMAQTPSFEVASIKPAAPQAEGRIMTRMGGDPGLVDFKNVSLRDLIRAAYDIKDYQLSAPDWMASTRFDVQARMPPDTPREKRNLMLQALLAERFKLQVHKEQKETAVLALVVAKNGPKLKESTGAPLKLGPDMPPPPPPPPGPGGRPGGGAMMMMTVNQGKFHMIANGVGIGNIADMVSRQVDKPVVDETGLTGKYDIDLEFKPEPGMGFMKGMPMPMPHPDGAGPAPAPPPENIESPSIYTALQEQLGLKLESKKGTVDLIVVDSAEKTPTEN